MKEVTRNIEMEETYLGIELGSTRIKAVLIDKEHNVLCSASHSWENQLVDGIWTYSLEAVWEGLRDAYAKLKAAFYEEYGINIKKVGGIGISAMMHGYMPFDKDDQLLVPFRTWRNTISYDAKKELTEIFDFTIPQRWCVAHLYQAILNKEEHVGSVNFLTTLSGYVHWKLTGQKVIGIGDASGIVPIDDDTRDYDKVMIGKFNKLTGMKLEDILPKIVKVGEKAGELTKEGASLLDEEGDLNAGIPLCPPEGDAGTGMVATNTMRAGEINISAGTSVFALFVLEKPLSKRHAKIEMMTTPAGDIIGMLHGNNCTGDLDAWVKLMGEAAKLMGADVDGNTLYSRLYENAFSGDADCGGNLSYNFISGEPMVDLVEGRPMFVRMPKAKFNLANFMRSHLYSSVATIKVGTNILKEQEGFVVDSITGHGGLFKQAAVGQRVVASALEAPVTVMHNAGEGGAWGIAILAAYMMNKKGKSLADYLSSEVFVNSEISTYQPTEEDIEGYNKFMASYEACIGLEHKAVEKFK